MAEFRKTSYKKVPTADYFAMKKAATAAKRAEIIGGIRTGQIKIVRSAGGRRLQRSMNARTGGLLGMELKFLDEALDATAIVAPATAAGAELDPTAGCIGCPAQGDGASNRDGRAYVVKSIDIRGVVLRAVQTNQTAGDICPTIYLALVQDMQSNGAQLNSEDVFTNPNASSNTAAAPLRNMNFITRFKVLDSCTMDLSQLPITYDGTNIEQAGQTNAFELKWRGAVKVNCSGTTQNINQVQDNSFHLIGFASSVNMVPQICYNVRTRFVG